MIIDTHCHLFKEDYDNIEEVIKNMEGNIIIVSGVNLKTNKEVINLCNKYKNIYGTIGIHPEELEDYNKESIDFIIKNIENPKIVGIGEIGLDYHYTKEFKEKQIELFKKQINIALKYKKPIVVHSRDAIEDTFNILKNIKGKIVLHCYSSTLEMALKFTKLGVMLGIGGVVTFKNAKKLKEVVKEIDLKYLLLETDSPYLTPEPYRGTKNEPKNTKYVAEAIASIKNIDKKEVIRKTTENAIKTFDLKINL